MSSDDAVQRAMRRVLSNRNCRTASVNGPLGTLNLLFRLRPSLVLYSVTVPRLSNCRLYTVLHRTDTFHRAPVIVLANGSNFLSQIGTQVINTGSCLAGPFNPNRLLTLIRGCINPNSPSHPHPSGLLTRTLRNRLRLSFGAAPLSH